MTEGAGRTRRGLKPAKLDIHVFKEADGKEGVDLAFFQSLESYERMPGAVVLEFVEGGKIVIPMRRSDNAIWTEPERH